MTTEYTMDAIRTEIIETARNLFNSKGFDNTTLQDLTESLEIAESVFHSFFSSLDDLLEAVWSGS